MYRCRTVWDTGALVSWSSDDISYGDFKTWSPYLGMEVGMTRMTSEKTKAPDHNKTEMPFVPLSEVMTLEEMIRRQCLKQIGRLDLNDDTRAAVEKNLK